MMEYLKVLINVFQEIFVHLQNFFIYFWFFLYFLFAYSNINSSFFLY